MHDLNVNQVFGDDAELYKLEDLQVQDLGKVGEVTITKDDTLFMKVCIFAFFGMRVLHYNFNIF